MAALYTDNIQEPARRPDYLSGEVTQPSESRLNLITCLNESNIAIGTNLIQYPVGLSDERNFLFNRERSA